MSFSNVSYVVSQVHTLNEQEWQRLEQAAVLANVRQAFDGNETEDDTADQPAPAEYRPQNVTNDAHTLALMLQDQLEAINAEIGYVEKNNYRMGGWLRMTRSVFK